MKRKGNNLLARCDLRLPGNKENQTLAHTIEGQRNIVRIQKTLMICDQLYQDIVAQQAVDAVKNVSRFEQVPQADYERTSDLEELEVFNTLPDLDGFSSGLQELEGGYFRLKVKKKLRIA